MESIFRRHGTKASVFIPIACCALAMSFSADVLADITNVSSNTYGSLYAEARVGHATPPTTIGSDIQPKFIGDSMPVAGLPDLSESDFTYAHTGTTVSGLVTSSADARGSVGRLWGQVAGDSLHATFVGASAIDLMTSLSRSHGSEPTNMVAESVGTMTTVGTVTFTVNVSSTFKANGYLDVFGPSTVRAWLVDASGVTLFDAVISQTEYDPNGFSLTKWVDAIGTLEPGTYTLWTTAVAAEVLETQTFPTQARIRANCGYSVQFEVNAQ